MFYLIWPWYYFRGMWSYRTKNPTTRDAIVETVCNEADEFFVAVHAGDLWDMFDEGFDVLHSLLLLWAWDVGTFFRLPFFCILYLMVILPVLAVPTAVKHARRMRTHGCVRNRHHCAQRYHACAS